MSAEPRSLKTDAEAALAAHYRAVRSTLPGSAAVAERRDIAFAMFERAGLPYRRVEAWKYTDLRAAMKRAAPIAPAPSAEECLRYDKLARITFGDLDRHRLVVADGHFQEALSDREALLVEGVEVATFAEFVGFESPSVLQIFDHPVGAERDALVALNVAFASDGAVVIMPDGCVLSKPIEVVHLTTGAEPRAWFSRSAAKIGKGARAKFLVSHVGPDGVAYQANSHLAIQIEKSAAISVVDLQIEGDAATHVATFSADLDEGASLRHLTVASGGRVSRLQAFAAIRGEGANLSAAGSNMLRGDEHGDINWRIDHIVPGATSRVLYKNIATDTAFGAFQGLILVRPDAQKTDGRMMTRTLLLSDEAQFAAKPELEIYADDVQCGHGATIGQVDEDALFYLMARGIPRPEAVALLVRAFLAEAIETLDEPAIGEALDAAIDGWLEGRGS